LLTYLFDSSKKNQSACGTAEDDQSMDEDKDEHDEEKLRKARDWDEWKDSKYFFA